jgi:hypothetical protein
MSRRRHASLAVVALALAACEGAPPPIEGPVIAADSVTTEARTTTVSLLPDGWGEALYVVHTPTGPVVGGDAGLFSLGGDGLEPLDSTPVRGLALFADEVFIARDDGLFVWEDGTLEASPITDALPEVRVTAIATQGEGLWLGTDVGVIRYAGGTLTSFGEFTAVTGITAATGADYVVIEGGESGGLFALAPNGEDWALLDLSDDPVDVVVPGPGQRLYGLAGDQLVARVEGDSGHVWRGVAVESGADAPAAVGITGLATAPSTAAVWAATDTHFIEIDGGRRTLVPAGEMGTAGFGVDGAGTLWISDGTSLSALPSGATAEVTWSGTIAGFVEKNCTRCHGDLGTATEMYTLTQWRESIDRIIQQLADGTMPADGAALVDGNADLLRAWKEGGLQE